MWCARWMRNAFVIPVGDSVASRSAFSDESSIIGKYDKRAAPSTKGDRHREKSGRTDAADSDYLSRNRQGLWGNRRESVQSSLRRKSEGGPFSNACACVYEYSLSERAMQLDAASPNRCVPLNHLWSLLEIDTSVFLLKPWGKNIIKENIYNMS